ncbi:hypothetical protein D9M71_665640 [compost metagenome]
MTTPPKHLLDDLRHATEFYRCEQETPGGQGQTSAEANEWLRSAALRLGEALLAATNGADTDEASNA